MGSVGSQRLKEPITAGTPDSSMVMSFSFDGCRLEEEAAGTAQGQGGAAGGVPGFTDSGELGGAGPRCVSGPEPGWAVGTLGEPWVVPERRALQQIRRDLPWGRSSRGLRDLTLMPCVRGRSRSLIWSTGRVGGRPGNHALPRRASVWR